MFDNNHLLFFHLEDEFLIHTEILEFQIVNILDIQMVEETVEIITII